LLNSLKAILNILGMALCLNNPLSNIQKMMQISMFFIEHDKYKRTFEKYLIEKDYA